MIYGITSLWTSAEAIAEMMMRESNVRLRAWLEKQIANAGEADHITEGGILVGTAATFDFNMDRIMVAQELTVRGLFFHEKRLALLFDCPIDVQHVPWKAAPNLVRSSSTAAPTRIQTKGNNAVWWGYNPFDGGNEFDTICQVCYNG